MILKYNSKYLNKELGKYYIIFALFQDFENFCEYQLLKV